MSGAWGVIGGFRQVGVVGVVLLSIGLAGCYTYRATAPEMPGVTETRSKVVWAFAWGAVNGAPPRVDNCQGQALAEVAVKENPGFWLVTLVTLGIASPKRVEWRCAPPGAEEGNLDPDGA